MGSEFDIEKKIKDLAALYKVSLKDVYTHIGMSKPGFFQMLQRKTYTLSSLQAIAQYFNVTVAEIIGEKPENSVVDPILEQTIEAQAQEIRTLKRMIELLEYKLQTTEKLLKEKH